MRTQYEYTLSSDEFLHIFQHNQTRLESGLPGSWVVQLLFSVVIVVLLVVAIQGSNLPGKEGGYIAGGALFTCAFLLLVPYFQRRRIIARIVEGNHLTGTPRTITVEEDGIALASLNGCVKYFWSSIKSAEEFQGSVSLYLDNASYYPIASSAFAGMAERDAFIAHVRNRIASAAAKTVVASSTPLIAPTSDADSAVTTAIDETAPAVTMESTSPAPLPALRQNISNAFNLTFLVRVSEERMPLSWWQAMCFALLSMVTPVVWALFAVGDDGEWNLYALPAALFHIPVLLFAAVLIAYAMSRLDKLLAFFQSFLMIAFAIDLVYYTLYFISYRLPDLFDISGGSSFFYYGCAAWMWLACAVAAIRIGGAIKTTRMAPFVIGAMLIALPLATVYRDRSLWERDYSRDKAAPTVRNDITAEDNFYRQPAILEQELAAVRPQRKGIVDVYFVGMAGYGGQDVFRREVNSVNALFRERFDADGRTIRLINNRKLAASAPVASVTSLSASLKRVAEQMDKEEDVLVLFLTSHGSETHRFSLELWPLQFKELDPATLRSLLDEAGIKHRVVVISACYSGGFTSALRNDDTLVITASAPDRNSFGCSNENEWTYFGKAYFDEALRTTTSFAEAFEIAKPVIAERETAQKYKPSNPQMVVGKNIAAKLERLQSELADPKSREAAVLANVSKPADDAAARYAALRYDRVTVEHQVRVCKATAHASGPDVVIATQPNAYGGLGPDSALWPRLVGSWKRYIDNVCDRTRDPVLLQTMYAQFLRDAAPTDELDALLRFVETPAGKRWLKAEKAADLGMTREVTRLQSENQASLYKIFLDEQQEVFKAYRAESKAKP